MEEKEPLTGGNTAAVVARVGSTVRKPSARATPAVTQLLSHLHRIGCTEAPRAYGLDTLGRQNLEFIEGSAWNPAVAHPAEEFRRVGSLIRNIHDATARFRPSESLDWDPQTASDGDELICHSDLGPWNLICGPDRWAFIDWDNATPGTRLWDLAWAAISFPPIEPRCDLAKAAAAVRAVLTGYRMDLSSVRHLIELMVRRARAECERIEQGAQSGELPWTRLYVEGHHLYWGPVASYIEGNAAYLEDLLSSSSAI